MISDHPHRRPYAAKVGILLQNGTEYPFEGEACLLIDGDFIIRIKPGEKGPLWLSDGPQRLTVMVEGFATASEAERIGLKLSLAFLWSSVSLKHHLRLEYHTPQPCVVFDRTSQRGKGITASARLTVSPNPAALRDTLRQVLEREEDVDPRILVSMELYGSSMLESTERAKFITLVSSLEPLAVQGPYGNEQLENAIMEFSRQLGLLGLPGNVRESVIGRAKTLSHESISQSIVRLVQTHIPDNRKAVECVKEAYDIRSKILHEGTFDVDLPEKGRQVAEIIRFIYSRMLKLDLRATASIET